MEVYDAHVTIWSGGKGGFPYAEGAAKPNPEMDAFATLTRVTEKLTATNFDHHVEGALLVQAPAHGYVTSL